MRLGELEKGSLGAARGGYSGIFKMSNCETKERVMLR